MVVTLEIGGLKMKAMYGRTARTPLVTGLIVLSRPWTYKWVVLLVCVMADLSLYIYTETVFQISLWLGINNSYPNSPWLGIQIHTQIHPTLDGDSMSRKLMIH
jgi:hypothetical protein